MPTPDIRNKLINQSKNSLTESKPLEAALFLPEIPSAASNKVIAPNIIDALEQTKKLNYRNINNERRRIDETTDILKETNLEIDSATKNIQAANSSILLDFQGIFDSQYIICEDYDMWLRIAREFKIRAISEPLIKYYQHS